MDASSYKKLNTTRGYTYNYYSVPAADSKPTLLFLHGFPSSSTDWRRIIEYFQPKGYGIIAPDNLGYAGTDKPADPKAYLGSALAKDLVEILDAENIPKVIVVGHDWGTRPESRLVNYFPDRVLGLAFITSGYIRPKSTYDLNALTAVTKQLAGRELLGYWKFFAQDGSEKLVEEHFDSFFSLTFPHEPSLWRDNMCPTGAIEEWLKADKTAPLPSYLTEEDKAAYKASLLAGGFEPLHNWWRVITQGLDFADDDAIPEAAYPIQQPVFFAASALDEACIPVLGTLGLKAFVKGPLTVKEFQADHWVILSHSQELSEALEKWIEGI
ncbi:alpha/beta-hydrolase [Auriscalpium vulgare]|uniref:Alpha/beta-hydrolase n=1 Tax=Auriscalpium vulgare TaxID=40419 RepID=A0ACB8RTV9_9AGAM|nr:alpha/beta-hydrolase [Auriscalpium vulgare]